MIAAVVLWALAQQPTLAARVAAAPDGEVRMTYAARPGLCDGHRRYESDDDDADVEWDDECDDGPVRVVVWVASHEPTRLRVHVGGRWRPRPAIVITDLGEVSSAAAADYLLSLAEGNTTRAGRDAIFAATIADSATNVRIWPRLLSLARDESKPNETRKQAVFWLGQAAADATVGLDSLVSDNHVDREVRESAIFALSQRPHDEGVPILINVAKNNPDPELRRKAMFWLGQTGDPRALALFEAILTGPSEPHH
jgi:HEAT repeats